MLQKFKNIIAGWQLCDADTYRTAYQIFGGSVCTHPDVLEYLSDELNLNISYYSHYTRGRLEGACYSVNGNLSMQDRRYPFVFDDVMLPISKHYRGYLPFKSKRLSPEHDSNFFNVLYTRHLKHKVAHVKQSFRNTSRRKRNSELKKFLQSGGEVRDVKSLEIEEVASIYIELFIKRWGHSLYCWTFERLYKTLKRFQKMIFGNVLFLNGIPCAIDLIFMSECNEHIYFDDINGGFLPSVSTHSLGSILLWVNITLAFEESKKKNKYCYFSLGIYQKQWSYKKQWCDIKPLGRCVI